MLDLRDRIATPENVGLAVAVVLSLIGAYIVQLRISEGAAAFLGLIVLGVSTPTTLTSHGLLGRRFVTAIARVGIAGIATFLAYTGLLIIVAGRNVGLLGATAAFVLTALVVEIAARILA